MSTETASLGFPPPILGECPLRVAILDESAEWLALDKPAGIGLRAHPWDSAFANLDAALNARLAEGRAEIREREASLFGSVYYLDPLITGVALFAKNRDSLARLRNGFGSSRMVFRFFFVSRPPDPSAARGNPGGEWLADAPLLPHRSQPRMIPSTAKGKKARTRFRFRGSAACGSTVWEAETNYPRPHQVRAHAALLGIPLAADEQYGGGEAPRLKELQPGKRGPGASKAVFEAPLLHLFSVGPAENSADNEIPRVRAPFPAVFRSFFRKAGLSELGLAEPGRAEEGAAAG